MNWKHFQAVLWLRWRLLVNQWRRAGALNAVLMIIFAIGAVITAVPLFIGCFLLGLYAIPKAEPVHLMYAWDGVILAFLFFWGIGLIAELQRSESLSLSNFLHLPISVNGVFLINYLSSLLRLSLIVFGPIMFGFALALIVVKGLPLVPVLPMVVALLLMVTALTYQVQGWLASLMENPRRRRTVVVVATATFILIAQLPQLLNFLSPWGAQQQVERSAKLLREVEELKRAVELQPANPTESLRRLEVLQQDRLARQQIDRENAERWEQTARIVNLVLPVGWLPLGVMTAAEGHVLPSILGILGMTLIGTASLWRAYRTTIGLYQGQPTNRKARPAAAVASPAAARKPGRLLLEAELPVVSEPVSAIALGGLRSLLRSPEAKMMLLTPLLMSFIFGSMIVRSRQSIPELMRPLVGIGAMGVVLLGVLQLMSNQFGFDRDGFRVFVLSSARRRDILLGKNLAFAPLALGMAAILLAAVQVLCPLRLDHLVAMVPQYISMFLMTCICTNLLSIYAPIYIAPGSLKPSNPKLTTVLLQLAMITFVFPLAQAVTLLPLGTEALLQSLGWSASIPTALVLSLVECAFIIIIYYLSLIWQGDLFQGREQRILETVTSRAP